MENRAPERLGGDLAVIKLFEIADRLRDQAAEGVLNSKELTVGTEWKTLETAWLSCAIFNDGDADVYIKLDDMSTHPWVEGEAPLKKGEKIDLDLRARGHKPAPSTEEDIVRPLRWGSPLICLICQSGTATVRVFKLF